MKMKNINQRVIEKLNKEIGSDLGNLYKAKYVVDGYKQRFKDIESKLSPDAACQSSKIKDALLQQEVSQNAIDIESEKIRRYQERLTERLYECSHVLTEVDKTFKEIQNFENFTQYWKILQEVELINGQLNYLLNEMHGYPVQAIKVYNSLYGEFESSNSLYNRLKDVEAPFLKKYVKDVAKYWHNILLEKLSKDFEALLKTIKWPPKAEVHVFLPPEDIMNKLSMLAEYLFLIKSPSNEDNDLIQITASINCPPFSSTTQLLLKQYRQRFLYHFTGNRQTNRLDKPEWYFTQILNWTEGAHRFVMKYFQSPAKNSVRSEHLNVRLEFVRGLVQLAIEKMALDIEDISREESLFAHLIDETLAFETELRDRFGYPTSFPSAVNVLTQPQFLLKWISIEETFSANKMDLIVHEANNPWSFIDPYNVEELKIPRCADQFIRLIDAIKDRYSILPQPRHQLQFLNLQLELIENFRRRLVQLHSSGNVQTTKILNAINYVTSVLREWGENVHYLHLNAPVVGISATEIDSVFERCVDELEDWQRKLVKNLSMKIVDEIKAKSMPYRHDNWISLPEQNSKEPFILSTSAGGMLQVIMSSLNNLEDDLSGNIFNITVRLIAEQLDNFFIESMIMITKFSMGGAAQFQHDIKRNLFPLFGQYVRRADLLFKRVYDACILLNMNRGAAMLLHQTLKDKICIEDKLKTLKEVGIVNLIPKISADVLERRTDIRTT